MAWLDESELDQKFRDYVAEEYGDSDGEFFITGSYYGGAIILEKFGHYDDRKDVWRKTHYSYEHPTEYKWTDSRDEYDRAVAGEDQGIGNNDDDHPDETPEARKARHAESVLLLLQKANRESEKNPAAWGNALTKVHEKYDEEFTAISIDIIADEVRSPANA